MINRWKNFYKLSEIIVTNLKSKLKEGMWLPMSRKSFLPRGIMSITEISGIAIWNLNKNDLIRLSFGLITH
jgi:hypothetical protein